MDVGWTAARVRIEAAIQSGQLKEGSYLPTIANLDRDGFGSSFEIRRAIRSLIADSVLSQEKPGARVRISQRVALDNKHFETYQAGFKWLAEKFQETDGDLTIYVCENWIPATVDSKNNPICESRDYLAALLTHRIRFAPKEKTRLRVLITWPGDTISLMSRIWTRWDTWGTDAEIREDVGMAFLARAQGVAKEVYASNEALKALASEFKDYVKIRYMMSWASCPLFLSSDPTGPLLCGMYHSSKACDECPAELLSASHPMAESYRNECFTLWKEVGLRYQDIKNQFSQEELAFQIYKMFKSSDPMLLNHLAKLLNGGFRRSSTEP